MKVFISERQILRGYIVHYKITAAAQVCDEGLVEAGDSKESLSERQILFIQVILLLWDR